jgi:hypothetical protein
LFDRDTKEPKIHQFYENVYDLCTKLKPSTPLRPPKKDGKLEKGTGPLCHHCLDMNVRFCRWEGHQIGNLNVESYSDGQQKPLPHGYYEEAEESKDAA